MSLKKKMQDMKDDENDAFREFCATYICNDFCTDGSQSRNSREIAHDSTV